MKNKIFIGDNLEVMESEEFVYYKNKIKCIYIDPPYNTKTVKSYNDRIHSDEWSQFMYPRLLKSKEMLTSKGVIFISIDDNEYANLKLICDDVFGVENHLGTFITNQAQRSNAKHINTVHEYILCYAKDKSKVPKFTIKRTDIPEEKIMIDKLSFEARNLIEKYDIDTANKKFNPIIKDYCIKNSITWLRNYNNIDEEGNIYFAVDLSTPGRPRRVSIPEIGLELEPLDTRGWSSDKRFIRLSKENRLVFKDERPYYKKYLSEATNNAQSILNFYSRQGTNDLKKLGLQGLFDTPKPVELIKFLIRLSTSEKDLILDFFAGSGTTAQAVYELNMEDKNNLGFVLIQNKEEINDKNGVYKYCKKNNIEPRVDQIMLHRIETFLNLNDIEDDFLVSLEKDWKEVSKND